MTLGSALSCITPSEQNLEEEEGGGGGLWGTGLVGGGNCMLWASFFIPRPVINTPRRGGETGMLPRQLACCCIRRDFCLKHKNNVTRRGRKKEVVGGRREGVIVYYAIWSLFLSWKGGGSFTLVESRQRLWGILKNCVTLDRKKVKEIHFPDGFLWCSERLIFFMRAFSRPCQQRDPSCP